MITIPMVVCQSHGDDLVAQWVGDGETPRLEVESCHRCLDDAAAAAAAYTNAETRDAVLRLGVALLLASHRGDERPWESPDVLAALAVVQSVGKEVAP